MSFMQVFPIYKRSQSKQQAHIQKSKLFNNTKKQIAWHYMHMLLLTSTWPPISTFIDLSINKIQIIDIDS